MNYEDIPKASIIQTGRYDPIYLTPNKDDVDMMNSQNNEINNNFEDPEIEEPDFIKNIIENNGSEVKEEEPPLIKSKYNMIELFCLINEEIFVKDKQVHCVDLSFNMDFGNLKITYYTLTPESIDNHVIFKQSMNMLTTATIYPSSAFRILNSDETEIVCMEQLINKTNEDWQKQRPMVEIHKEKNKYSVIIHEYTKKRYMYVFENWQAKAFEHSLEFVYNTGFNLRGNTKLKT